MCSLDESVWRSFRALNWFWNSGPSAKLHHFVILLCTGLSYVCPFRANIQRRIVSHTEQCSERALHESLEQSDTKWNAAPGLTHDSIPKHQSSEGSPHRQLFHDDEEPNTEFRQIIHGRALRQVLPSEQTTWKWESSPQVPVPHSVFHETH